MSNVYSYRYRANALLVQASGSGVDDAKTLLATVRQNQKQLRQIKKEINLDMKVVRAEYKQLWSEAKDRRSWWQQAFLGKSATERARVRRETTRERDEKLQPYGQLKIDIDEMLVQMDGLKLKLQKYISENK